MGRCGSRSRHCHTRSVQRRRVSGVTESDVVHDPHGQFFDIEHPVGSRDFAVVRIDPRSACDVLDHTAVLDDDQQHEG